MITRIALAVVLAALIGILLDGLVGPLLLFVDTPPTQLLGGFVEAWAWGIAVLCGVWYFFANGGLAP